MGLQLFFLCRSPSIKETSLNHPNPFDHAPAKTFVQKKTASALRIPAQPERDSVSRSNIQTLRRFHLI